MLRMTMVLGLALMVTAVATATTYRICPDGSGDFETIQEALDVVAAGDSIALCDAVFTGPGNVDLLIDSSHHNGIVIHSESGNPEACIIDCNGSPTDPHRGMRISFVDSTFVLKQFTLRNAWVADHAGGGIYFAGSSCRVDSCIFETCAGQHEHGGGGSYIQMGTPTFTHCTWRGNSAPYGAGVRTFTHVSQPLHATFIDCVFEDNHASIDGGAVYCGLYGASANAAIQTFEDCDFIGNTAVENGGAIYHDSPNGGSLHIDQCTFAENSAANHDGGGVLVRDEGNIAASVFCSNTAAGEGGGLLIDGANCHVSESVFYGNAAATGGAVFVSEHSSNALIDGCTLSDNDAPVAAGIRVLQPLEVSNTIIAFGAQGEAVSCEGAGSLTLTCSDVFGNDGGAGCAAPFIGIDHNIALDPRFCDRDCDQLYLCNTSPCAPDNNPSCGLIGALSIGCQAAPLELISPNGGEDLCVGDLVTIQWDVTPNACNGEEVSLELVREGEVCLEIAATVPLEQGVYDWAVEQCGTASSGYTIRIRDLETGTIEESDGPFYIGRTTLFVTPDGSGDYPAIQNALDAACSGDTVLLADGIYTGPNNKNLSYRGKDLTVRSLSGDPLACIVDCEGDGRGFYFHNDEDRDAVLDGVCIQNAHCEDRAGAIYCARDNNPWTLPGPTIKNCILLDSYGAFGGGGLYAFHCNPLMDSCVVCGDSAGSYGGGIMAGRGATITVRNCTLASNWAANGGGGAYVGDGGHMILENTIIAYSVQGEAVLEDEGDHAELACCCISGNEGGPGDAGDDLGIDGNFAEDPRFCGLACEELYLCPSSPCTAENNPTCGLIGAWGVGCEPGPVELVCPNGGEDLSLGEPYTIEWNVVPNACNGDEVSIELLREGEVCLEIAAAVPLEQGFYEWVTEQCGEETEGYTVRITDLETGVSEESDGAFRIRPHYRLTSITDCPNDQGRQVRACWHRADDDQSGTPYTITQYSVWRRIDLRGTGQEHDIDADKGAQALVYPPGDWEFVTELPACGEDYYCTICPTLCDSTIAHGPCWSVFFVRAHTEDPLVFFDTAPDSGYSVDNLAPAAPAGLAWLVQDEIMTWEEAPEEDFDYFTVYGSDSYLFDVEEAEVIGHTAGTEMDVSNDPYPYYHVTATDFAGNIGRAAPLCTYSAVPPVHDDLPPKQTLLHPNTPNPMTSETTIRFDLAVDTEVQLVVLDATGRIVSTLIEGRLSAGQYRVPWSSADFSGHPMPSGVYFACLNAGDTRQMRRMLVIR